MRARLGPVLDIMRELKAARARAVPTEVATPDGAPAAIVAPARGLPETASATEPSTESTEADESSQGAVSDDVGIGRHSEVCALARAVAEYMQQCALSAVANTSFVPAAVASGALGAIGQLLFAPDEATQKMGLTALFNLLAGGHAYAESLLQAPRRPPPPVARSLRSQ